MSHAGTLEITRTDERAELLRMLAEQRETLLITVRGITDEQAVERTTVSALTLGGLVKHLTQTERFWMHVLTNGKGEMPADADWEHQYEMVPGDTLQGHLDAYAAQARATEEIVAGLPDLDFSVPLPVFPWSPPETVHWSARHVLMHIFRETAQHCGHADIIREALDGASTTAQMSLT